MWLRGRKKGQVIFQVDGLNLHHKFKISIKRPLGGGSSFIQNIAKHPGATITGGLLMGPGGALLGSALDATNTNMLNKAHDTAAQAGRNPNDPGANDQSMIEAKYNQLAQGYQAEANPLRAKLAASLANYAKGTFEQENPYILEDLNARGLSTSPTAVAQAQSQELGRLSLANNQELNNFDTDVFNQVQNLRTTGVGTGLQRLFDVHDQAAQAALAQSLARRRSRDAMYGSGIGAAGDILGAILGGS